MRERLSAQADDEPAPDFGVKSLSGAKAAISQTGAFTKAVQTATNARKRQRDEDTPSSALAATGGVAESASKRQKKEAPQAAEADAEVGEEDAGEYAEEGDGLETYEEVVEGEEGLEGLDDVEIDPAELEGIADEDIDIPDDIAIE